jgi:peptidoglycan/xylan/chitin deacetylase (PgdA/CDA1 family)
MTEARTLAVLCFRSIGGPEADRAPAPATVSEARFEEMLAWIRRSDWSVIAAADAGRGARDPAALPERGLLLTFDGGCRTVLERGLPLLRRYRFPAVVFVATDLVGQEVTFGALESPVQVCTWNELVQLDRNDVSVQSSGVGRRRFSRLSATEQERAVIASRDAIAEHVGGNVTLFAYPPGPVGRGPQILRLAGYDAGFTLAGGVNALPGADPYQLARIEVEHSVNLADALAG